MISISLCMIVKNEEAVLARCLDSVADLVDEVVIVDTGSTDRTREIAAKYTDRIFDFKWVHDFSAARNYAFSLASCEYIYSADADEVLKAARDEILGMVIEEAKDHIDEEQENREEEAEEIKEEREEQEELLEERKENEEELEDLMEDMPIDEMADLKSTQEQIRQEVQNVVNKMHLVTEDIKGAMVDTNL